MKVARVFLSKEILEKFLKADVNNREFKITSNTPSDLEILGLATHDLHPFTFEAYVKSESFTDIPEGAMPPLIEPFHYSLERYE